MNIVDSTIGQEKTHQPECILENARVISPLIKAKNLSHAQEDVAVQLRLALRARILMCKHQRLVKMAVHKAKDEWVHKVALEGAETSTEG